MRVLDCLRLLSLATTATACVAPVEVDGRGSAIIDGELTDDMPAVAFLGVGADDSFCSAVLVSPHVLVTAAHCVDSRGAGTFEVFFGPIGAADGFVTADVRVHPRWIEEGVDIALVVIEAAAPAEPIAGVASLAELAPGVALEIVGYGNDERFSDGSAKRSGVANLGDIDEQTFTVIPGPNLPCSGDSGSPALFTGEAGVELVGIASASDCESLAEYVRGDVIFTDFVSPAVEAIESASPTLGQPCLFDEQCDDALCVRAPDEPSVRYCAAQCADSCPADTTCEERPEGSVCIYPPPSPGAFGWPCEANDECVSGICLGFCTEFCLRAGGECPTGYRCEPENPVEPRFVCVPASASGCAAVPSPGEPIVLWLGLLSVLAVRGRRRRDTSG